MRYSIWFIILFFQVMATGRAHSPSETFATIRHDAEVLTVHLEMPWSIAEAVKAANPQLGDNHTEREFWPFLISYIKTHVKVMHDNKALPIISIRESPGEHTHSAMLVLTYPERDLSQLTIHNTLLFNLYKHQENHLNVIWQDGTASHYSTTPTQSYIDLPSENNMRNVPFLIGLVLFGAIGCIFLQQWYADGRNH